MREVRYIDCWLICSPGRYPYDLRVALHKRKPDQRDLERDQIIVPFRVEVPRAWFNLLEPAKLTLSVEEPPMLEGVAVVSPGEPELPLDPIPQCTGGEAWGPFCILPAGHEGAHNYFKELADG